MQHSVDNVVNWSWVAGIFEGEGSFGSDLKSRGISVSIAMTDKDVIDKLYSIIGYGRIRQRKKKENRKIAWEWATSLQYEVFDFIWRTGDFLGDRRAERMAEIIEHACRPGGIPNILPIDAFGERKTLKEWAKDDKCVVTYWTLWDRVRRNVPVEEAIIKANLRGT